MTFHPTEDASLTTPLRYLTSSDSRMRLRSTFIRIEHEGNLHPVFVENVDEESLYIYINDVLGGLGDRGYIWKIHSSDKRLDISSPPIGWTNGLSGPYFLARAPVNSQKQGVQPTALLCARLDKNGQIDRGEGTPSGPYFRWKDRSEMDDIAKSIAGIFPKFSVAYASGVATAISRDWCLSPLTSDKGILFFKTQAVALVDHKNQRVSFGSQYATKTQTASLAGLFATQGVPYVIETLY